MGQSEVKPCRACGERPRAPGKMRCRECLDAAKAAPDLLADLQDSLERPGEVPVEMPLGRTDIAAWMEHELPTAPDAGLPYPGGMIVESTAHGVCEMRDGYDIGALHARIAELEEEVELLRNPLSAAERWRIEKAEILDKLADRAKAGDVQAIKAWSELRKLEAMEAETTGQVSIDDLVVPAGTRVDSTPTKEKP